MKKFVSCSVVDGDDNVRGQAYIQFTEDLEIEKLKLRLVSFLEEDGKKHNRTEDPGSQVVPAKKKLACPEPGCESALSSKFHLRRHRDDVHGPKTICPDCYLGLSKVKHLSE